MAQKTGKEVTGCQIPDARYQMPDAGFQMLDIENKIWDIDNRQELRSPATGGVFY